MIPEKPLPYYKKFNKVRYKWHGYSHLQKNADKRADKLRSEGYYARIVKGYVEGKRSIGKVHVIYILLC